ncbi:MAG: Gfo/Idh/MocA family oxidoreductase [Kiritimatiellae bacterium]|nr:Gfo/Idh/MocA family oxidoreductase [Kiritimatiellia bacterium]
MRNDANGQSRRDFLAGAGFAAMSMMAGGCASGFKLGGNGSMSGFRAPRLERVRVGVVGVGSRGTYALKRLAFIPGVDVAAFCDINEEAMKRCRDFLAEKKLRPAREFLGPEAYKGLCQWDGVDVVYACVPWKLHAPVAIEAMRGGKHAFVEVPAAMDVDSCWELVKTSEATRRHCMMLENCCYGENEMLALNMCRLGVLGETVYGEAGYLHSGKTRGFKLSEFRAEWYQEHRGNYYPTHGLGPVAQYMNINRGDRFDYLCSMETKSVGDLIREGDPRWNGENLETFKKYKIGTYNSSLIRTVNGKVILLNLSCSAPHPYSRINTIQGTHGIFMDYPLRIDIEDTPGSGPHEVHRGRNNENYDSKRTAMYREKYMHPLWKQIGELAKKAGGHGGMDFLMDLRWVYCLQNGLPLDMDVYDLASWSCLCEITEKSQARGGEPTKIPDFTDGAWKTMQPLGIVTIDVSKMDFSNVGKAGPQQTIGHSKEG